MKDLELRIQALEYFFEYVFECEGSDERPRVSKYIARLENGHSVLSSDHLPVLNELVDRINKDGRLL